MTYNVNLVLGLSVASIGMFAEAKSRKFTNPEKFSEPDINRVRDISLIAMYCLARNYFSSKFFKSSFDVLTLGVSFFHFAQLTSLLKNDDETFSNFANSLFATYRVACRLFIISAAFSSIYANFKELKQEEIAAVAVLKRQNILKNYLLILSEYVSLVCSLPELDEGLKASDTDNKKTSSESLPSFLEPINKKTSSESLPSFLEPIIAPTEIEHSRKLLLQQLIRKLFSSKQNSRVMLVGYPGAGKTHLLKELAYMLEPTGDYRLVRLKPNYFRSDYILLEQDKKLIDSLCAFIKTRSKVILVIDDVEKAFHLKEGRECPEILKRFYDALDESTVPIIAVSRYNPIVVKGEANYKFPNKIIVPYLSGDILQNIINSLIKSFTESIGFEASDEYIGKIKELFPQVKPDILKDFPSPTFEKIIIENIKAQIDAEGVKVDEMGLLKLFKDHIKAFLETQEQLSSNTEPGLPDFLSIIPPEVCCDDSRTKELEQLEENTIYNEFMPHTIILGEAGQGKSYLVKQFASLLGSKYGDKFVLLKLDLDAFAAETKWLGEQEVKATRLKTYFNNNPNSILVIDEFHHVVSHGRGGLSERLGLADKLKLFLENPQVRIIALTTNKEYDLYVQDEALRRRFPYTIQIRPLPPQVLQKVTTNLVKDLANSIKEHTGELEEGEIEGITRLFQDNASRVPNHMKSPFFERTVLAGVKARVLLLQTNSETNTQLSITEIFSQQIQNSLESADLDDLDLS